MADSAIEVSPQDRKLVRLLQANARASYQELAEPLGVSPSTVRRWVERLVANKTLKFVAFPAWEALGLNFVAFIGLSVDFPHLRSVATQLAEMDEICFVTLTAGIYDIFAQVVLPRNEDLVRFSTERVGAIEGIREMQTLMIPEIIKGYDLFQIPAEPDPLYGRSGVCAD